MFTTLKHPVILAQYLLSTKIIDPDLYSSLNAEIRFSELVNEYSKQELTDEIIDIFTSVENHYLSFLAASHISLSNFPLLELGVNIQYSYYDAIEFYLKNHQITDPLANITMKYNDCQLCFTITPTSKKEDYNKNYIFSTEYHLGEIVHLIGQYMPFRKIPKKITLRYDPPSYACIYSDILNCKNIEFNSERNTITFQVSKEEIFRTPPLNYALIGNQIFNLLYQQHSGQQTELSLKDRIISILNTYDEGIPNEHFIANQLNMHPRTLRRKLEKDGESFRTIITNYKKEKSIKLLIETKLNQKQIAKYLGFKDTTSFGRAFKTWTGKTPKEFAKHSNKL